METIIVTVMIICLFFSIFGLVANVTGALIFKIIVRIISIIGVLLPILYFLNQYEIIVIN